MGLMADSYYKDNREFIKALDEAGLLVTVEQEVDWDLEMGAIVRRVCEMKGPSPYFKSIKDYPGFEALGAPLATYPKLALALGLSPDTPIPDVGRSYVERTGRKPIDPAVVGRASAPCKQNVFTGDDVSLFDLPGPMVHDGDGGRYLATWHMVVSREPDTGDVNWGMYRQMVFDEKTMVGPVLPFSDMGKMFYNKHVLVVEHLAHVAERQYRAHHGLLVEDHLPVHAPVDVPGVGLARHHHVPGGQVAATVAVVDHGSGQIEQTDVVACEHV